MPDNSALPLFEQPTARNLKLAPGSTDYLGRARVALGLDKDNSAAHTESYGNKVFVDEPSMLTEPILAHEVIHKIQQHAGAFPMLGPTPNSEYDYGSIPGLNKIHGDIGKLDPEQQADIPRNYQEQMQDWAKQQITPRILDQADQMNSAYARPMQQLANMANPSSTTINTTPAAPGPPPAALTGMIKPLPEIGGKSLYSK